MMMQRARSRASGINQAAEETKNVDTSDGIIAETKSSIVSSISTWLVGVAVLAVVAVLGGLWIALKPSVIVWFSGNPAGLVAAFDLGKCPDGWEDFKAAESRFIIAAGSGDKLTTRALGTQGGREAQTLTVPQLPPHSHAYPDWGPALAGAAAFSGGNGGGGDRPRQTSNAGGGPSGAEPIEIMPPWIALRMCKKL